MAAPTYWLDLFTAPTWQEFLVAGADTSGFSERRWNTVKKIRPGDILLCYLTGVSRWIGALEVTSEAYRDDSPIWTDAEFPSRLKVRALVALEPETAVPVLNMRDELSVFQDLKNPNRWSGPFRASPAKWKREDGETILAALRQAEENPVRRHVDPRKLAHRPKAFRSSVGPVSVPEASDADAEEAAASAEPVATKHTEVQHELLRLGGEMGLDVWVARNDRSRTYNGSALSEMPRSRAELPHQFDRATNSIIELIDVLWLEGSAIVAAFEIESTTSVYSGLLRMSDLLALQPNLNIPLFLVAPDSRRDKVMAEVNRPTFSSLPSPLSEVCRYISFEGLESHLANAGDYLRYMKPDFLQEVSESCALTDE